MAAGQGFKTFVTGEVLTAGDVNGYLMQGINVFADAAARDAAITAPQEGQFAYTKDNNSLWYYTGSAWVASGATGDIEGVTAGVGISGGGTSGTVTITNSMATAIDAKGDLVAGTGADAFSRIAVGANGTVLTADSTAATGLAWAAAGATSDIALITSGSITASSSGISLTGLSSYDTLELVLYNLNPTSATDSIRFYINGSTTGTTWQYTNLVIQNAGSYVQNNLQPYTSNGGNWVLAQGDGSLNNGILQSVTPGFPNNNQWRIRFTNCKASGMTYFTYYGAWISSGSQRPFATGSGICLTETAVSSIQFNSIGQTFYAAGGYYLYGA